jgi:hypothetical protein
MYFFYKSTLITLYFIVMMNFSLLAQPGLTEINQATTEMGFMAYAMLNLSLVLGALFGLVGGLRVYNNWQMGRDRIDVQVIGWFSACLFLLVANIFITALFL